MSNKVADMSSSSSKKPSLDMTLHDMSEIGLILAENEVEAENACGVAEYVAFAKGERKCPSGATHSDIVTRYTESDMERDHEFIQWLFPLDLPSSVVSNAPVIDLMEFVMTMWDPAIGKLLREKQIQAYVRMMNHWGFEAKIDTVSNCVQLSVSDHKKLSRLNGHNALRFCRALQSLVYHGLENLARTTLDAILTIANKSGIRPSMMDYGDMTVWGFYLGRAVSEMDKARENAKKR
jgi:hypothetical protein